MIGAFSFVISRQLVRLQDCRGLQQLRSADLECQIKASTSAGQQQPRTLLPRRATPRRTPPHHWDQPCALCVPVRASIPIIRFLLGSGQRLRLLPNICWRDYSRLILSLGLPPKPSGSRPPPPPPAPPPFPDR